VESEIIALMYYRAQAQVTSDPERFVFDTMENLRRLMNLDPTSVDGSGGMYASAAGLFAYGGLSFSIGQRFLDLAEGLIDPADVRESVRYQMMRYTHHFLSGDWDDRYAIDERLIEEDLRRGEIWDITNYLFLDARRRLHQGRFEEAIATIEEIAQIEDQYHFDLAKTSRLADTMLLHLERRELEPALEVAEAHYAEADEESLNVLALGTKAKILILMGDLGAAAEALSRARVIVERSRALIPFQLSSYVRSQFMLDVAEYEAALAAGNRRRAAVYRKRSARSGRRAARIARKAAWKRPETYRLLGRRSWLADRRSSAFDWWRKSLREATDLGMRPEMGRTFLEVGRHGRAFDLRRTGIDPLTPEECVARARGIFEELGLRADLAELERLEIRD
jgi:hypothetical protein